MRRRGFTLVELLIVIVVIAILASIATISYNGIQDRANDVSVQADLRNSYNLVQISQLEEGKAPKTNTELSSLDIKVSQGSYKTNSGDEQFNFVYCPPYPYNTSDQFAFIGTSKSGTLFSYSGAGLKEYTGSHTMADYVDVCLDVVDLDDEFENSPYYSAPNPYDADPNLWITSPGYSINAGSSGGWRAWAGGPY